MSRHDNVQRKTLKLTPRLSGLAALVPFGARLADIGTDHGKLPITLLLSGQITAAIGSDVREGPLSHAARNAVAYGATLPLRLSSGLSAVQPEECDTISIAGMGGETIAKILSAAPWTNDGKHLLLLQPMTTSAFLRQWLWANGYQIARETLCREEKRWYVILSVYGGGARQSKPLSACVVSSALLRATYADQYLSQLLDRAKRVLSGMERGYNVSSTKVSEQREIIHVLQDALQTLRERNGKT